MKSNKINKNEKGVILVMAMMILALMMTSVLALSKIIRGEINMTRNIDNSIIAFYVAESGIEKSLYYIKYSAENNDFSYFTNLNGEEYSFSDDNERKIKITEATIEADYWEKYNIERGSPVHVDIIDPTGRVDAISGMTNYKIEWNIENCADNSDNRLEFTKESFAYAFNNADTSKTPITCACGEGSDSCLDYEGTIAANRYYRFSFEPLDEELVSYLKFTAWRDDDEGIKSEVSIKIEGSYRNSVQHLQARLPALGRISDVFSYVIFSGGDLTKNITCDDVVCGCTDEDADYGYNSDAVMDDGSCIYYGCSDLDSYNYNSKADSCSGADNDNSCCTYLVMYMATDNNGNTFLSDGDSLGVWPYGPSQTCSENKGESGSELEIVDSKLRAFIGASGTGFRGEEEGFYFPENEDYNKSGAKIYWYNFTDSTTELLADNWSDMFYGGDIIKSQLEGTGINEDSWVGSLGGDIGGGYHCNYWSDSTRTANIGSATSVDADEWASSRWDTEFCYPSRALRCLAVAKLEEIELLDAQIGCDDPTATNYNVASAGCNQGGNNSCCEYIIDGSSVVLGDMEDSAGSFEFSGILTANNSDLPIDNFTGTLTGLIAENGAPPKIKGITIDSNSNYGTGLFSRLEDAEINNIILEVGSISGGDNVGGLVGIMEDSIINNVSITTGSITGDSNVGGLVGKIDKSTINTSYSTVSVTGDLYVGGLVGYNNESSSGPFSEINNSYSQSSITGRNYIGGLIGKRGHVSFDDSYSASYIYSTATNPAANYSGGLAGDGLGGIYAGLYYDCTILADIDNDIFCNDSNDVFDKTTEEMMDYSTFANVPSNHYWDISQSIDSCLSFTEDCDDIWYIDNDNDYPHLQWEYDY